MGSLQDGNRWVVTPEGASCGGSRGILPRRFYALVPIPKGAGRSAGGAVGSHRPLFGLGPWVGAPVAPQQSRILRPVLPQLCDRVRGRGPFRSLFIHRGERERSRGGQPERCHPAGVRRSRPAGSFEPLQGLTQPFVLHPQRITELGAREHHARQQIEHLVLERALLLVVKLGDDFEMGLIIAGNQLQIDGRGSRSSAVFAGKQQVFLGAAEVEVRVTKGMDVAGAAQSLAGR